MKKKIRTITVTQSDYLVVHVNDEQPKIQSHINHYQEFDLEGHLLKDARYNRNGELEEMYEYTFNTTGLPVTETYYLEENEAAETKSFEYNTAGKPIQVLKHYLDGSVDTTIYVYNDAGQLIRTERKDDEGETEQVEQLEWKNDRLSAEFVFDGNGNPLIRRSMQYDEKGNISELILWNADDETEVRTVNEYDENDYLVSVKRFNNDGELIDATIFQQDEEGNLVSFTENAEGPKIQSQVLYNDKRKPVREEEVTEEGDVLTRVERKYDEADRESETEVFIDGQGRSISRHYVLRYEYTFFEQ